MKTKQTNTDELEEMRTHLKTAAEDLDKLIEHFDHPSYNPAQLQVMRRVKLHINSAAEQLDEIAGSMKP
jgi:hypothetical protein